MKVKLRTWREFVARYGDFEARRKLRCATRGKRFIADVGLFRANRDPFALISDLLHHWTGQTPSQRRKQFAEVIRAILHAVRRQRQRVMGLCAPGVAHQMLP